MPFSMDDKGTFRLRLLEESESQSEGRARGEIARNDRIGLFFQLRIGCKPARGILQLRCYRLISYVLRLKSAFDVATPHVDVIL